MDTKRRSVICSCGGDVYEPTVDVDKNYAPIWRCANCFALTPRRRGHRRTNHLRAVQAYLDLRKAWEATDAGLDALITAGTVASGALLVYSSVWNWHLKQLTDKAKPTNFEVRYHTAEAKKDLAKAAAFIEEQRALTNPA